ncbi:Gustatory receptor 83, partial [Hyalella azteca]
MDAHNYNIPRLLKWEFNFLRLLGLAPYGYSNGKYFLSQTQVGFTIVLNIAYAVLACWLIFPFPKRNDDIFESIDVLWGPFFFAIMLTLRWIHILSASKNIVKLLRLLRCNTTTPQKLGARIPMLGVIVLMPLSYNIYTLSAENNRNILKDVRTTRGMLEVSLSVIVSYFNYFPYFALVITLNTLMGEMTADLNQINRVLYTYGKMGHMITERHVISLRNEFSERGGSASDYWKQTSMEDVKRGIIKIRRAVVLIQKIFSFTVFAVLAFEQLEIMMITLNGERLIRRISKPQHVYGLRCHYSACFCADGVYCAKKRQADIACMGPRYKKMVWQLRGIQVELERMPRFMIFGLFELGRPCLLA